MPLYRTPWKLILCLIAILCILSFAPDLLYSQTNPPPPTTSYGARSNLPPLQPPPGTATSPIHSTTPPGTPATTSTTSGRTPATHKTAGAKNQSTNDIVTPATDFSQRPSLISQAILLSLLSLLPFIIMILSSFLKIVVVLSLLRTALGVQQAPPNQIINGVAFLLSIFIMYPTCLKMYDAAQGAIHKSQVPESFLSPSSSEYVIEVVNAAKEPLRDFIKRNSEPRHQALFYRLVYRGLPENYRDSLKPDDFIVLVPSYITGQLKDAFEIGVLIYIPFFVIDLVTSNILLAMGMMMLSPVTISMPLKLFLLVMLDGWTILIEGLVKTFQ